MQQTLLIVCATVLSLCFSCRKESDREFAEARPGQRVRVIHGTFKGLTGKLVRYKNRFYVVITLATLGIFVHIPKWYCEAEQAR